MNTLRYLTFGVVAVGLAVLVGPAAAQPPDKQKPFQPKIAKASDEGRNAITGFEVAKGVAIDLAAAEPMLANPVAFHIDNNGNFYVAETFRLHRGVTDNRRQRWLSTDLAARTIEDRLAMYKKFLGKNFWTYGTEHDRIRKIIDSDGDGKLDKAMVFADGFNHPLDGLGSGVISRGNKVWYTCIPDVWLLEDTDGDGKSDKKKSLHKGYGVHVSFLGHDSHGLKFGPYGKLYFSIGDRGLNVKTKDAEIALPDTGAVLRCNPDGSELELVSYGMRNPQELVFDEYGNLFTGDNNADAGDKARWVHVVDGIDCGWRIGYQYLKSPPDRLGPWKAERMWELRNPKQPAYIIPPRAHISSGPSGLTYHPGVSLLPKRYEHTFFLCDFRGGPNNSGIHSFQNEPDGATFKVVNQGKLISRVLVTDGAFGPDGAFYLSDWINGWGMPGKGRIYKLYDRKRLNDPEVVEVKKLLAEGMTKRSSRDMVDLIGHKDMRVRQEVQFTLASRGAQSVPLFHKIATRHKNQLARIHGIWGIGQFAGNQQNSTEDRLAALLPIFDLTTDKNPEIRAQAVKCLQFVAHPKCVTSLLPRLQDASLRVRFLATLSLSKQGTKKAIGPIVEMLRANKDQDVYLRHAGVMALTRLANVAELEELGKDPSPTVRMAALLAMRRHQSPAIAMFLNDADKSLVLEAARAINDLPITKALPQLASAAGRTGLSDAFTYRALNANFRLGQSAHAMSLASYAGNPKNPEGMRIEAIKHLQNWANPSDLDRVTGLFRPLTKRPKRVAAAAMRTALGGILTASNKIRQEGAKTAAKLGIKEVGPALLKLVTNESATSGVRVESLAALVALKNTKLEMAIDAARKSRDATVRAEGRHYYLLRNPKQAVAEIEQVLNASGSKLVEKQKALQTLGRLPKGVTAENLIVQWMNALIKKEVHKEIALDVLLAAQKRKASREVNAALAKYEASLPAKDELAKYRVSIAGGNAERGRRIFFNRTEVSCVRCHNIKGVGGNVGPELTHVAKDKTRTYLLESLVAPSKEIAKGYDQTQLLLKSGVVKSGVLKSEDNKSIKLMTPEGALITITKSTIQARRQSTESPMPADLMKNLSLSDVRDLVEYLSTLK
ncbi:MAG: PVC-type heme-binding CxxCH protein [Gemmataceae bacterium]